MRKAYDTHDLVGMVEEIGADGLVIYLNAAQARLLLNGEYRPRNPCGRVEKLSLFLLSLPVA